MALLSGWDSRDHLEFSRDQVQVVCMKASTQHNCPLSLAITSVFPSFLGCAWVNWGDESGSSRMDFSGLFSRRVDCSPVSRLCFGGNPASKNGLINFSLFFSVL